MNVAAWLRGLGLEEYVRTFADNDIDAHTLRLLTEADLVAMGVTSVGHKRKLAAAIANLAEDPDEPVRGPAPIAAHRAEHQAEHQAEHRQLSILYCDMVGSTALSQRLDPEEYREVIRSFHDRCVRTVAKYDGWVANFIGDCVLAYFGWPRAHEDDPERAVHTGLALARTFAASGIQARVGIATGPVVVGDLISEGPAQEHSAVGTPPELAAQLQALAEPGQVVIDELTCRLAPSFAARPLRRVLLDGIRESVPAYTVTGERHADGRFDARRGHELAPMIGRVRELSLLMERWTQAEDGEGTVVLLVGEAGIGKSRLARAMLDACMADALQLRWQCSPHHMGSALWPVIQQLTRAAGLQPEDSTEEALDKLQATVGESDAAAMYATLLGLNGAQRYGPLEMTPQMLRERTLEVLAEQLFERAKQQPLLLVVEDAHWIDPTTLELIVRCLDRINQSRMLVLLTSRPENQPRLAAHPSVTLLSLNRLNRSSVHELVTLLSGDRLQPHTLATIVAQTDGVPLFVEELTKAVLETGETAIPASLHGSLMARLDGVPDVKEVAQIAACIGREFDQALVETIADRPDIVGPALKRLAAAEIVFHRTDRSGLRFVFKHALVQEAACESLLRARRRAIHSRILAALEMRPYALPEVLAHHAAHAEDEAKAIHYYRAAGETALRKSAYHEAASYFSKAIERVEALPRPLGGADSEFILHLRLGQAAMPAFGQAAPITGEAFRRAYQLLDKTHDPSLHLQVRFGVWVGHWARGEFPQCLRLAQDWLAALASDPEAPSRQVALRLAGTSHSLMGELAQAQHYLQQAVDLYDPCLHGPLTVQLGYEPGAVACGQLAWNLALMGSLSEARTMLDRAHDVVASQAHVAAKAVVSALGCTCASLWQDADLLEHEAKQLGELATSHRLPTWQGYSLAFQGWRCLVRHQYAEAAVHFDRGIKRLASTSTRLALPYHCAGLASALAATNRIDEARACIEQAIAECEATGGRWCEAELWRVRGEVILAGEPLHHAEATRSFTRALSVARSQGARLWEQRVSLSLARRSDATGERPQPAAGGPD